MIDIEDELFSEVYEKLKEKVPDVNMTSEYIRTPSSFPHVSFVESDNTTYEQTITSSTNENHCVVTYDVNVYSNKTAGKKSECKKIASELDKIMNDIGFIRTMKQPIPNENNATVYRLVLRYTAIVSKNKTIYRR